MRISSRIEAFTTLGLPVDASYEEVKIAYKSLCKMLHPDVNPNAAATEQYYRVVEAYEYLLQTTNRTVTSAGRVMKSNGASVGRVLGSNTETLRMAARKREFKIEHDRQEKNRKKRQELKKQELEEHQRKLKEDREYEKAMSAINAIRAARAIELSLKKREEDNNEEF